MEVLIREVLLPRDPLTPVHAITIPANYPAFCFNLDSNQTHFTSFKQIFATFHG